MMTARSFFWQRPVLFRPVCFRKRKLKYFDWRSDYIQIVLECRGENNYFPGGYNRCFLHFLVYLLNLNFMGQFSEIWPQHKENNWWSKPNFNNFANLQTMIELNDLKEKKFHPDVKIRKVNFCMFMIINPFYFHFFKKNPSSSFSPFIFLFSLIFAKSISLALFFLDFPESTVSRSD